MTAMTPPKSAGSDLLFRYKTALAIILILLGVALRYAVSQFPGVFQGGFGEMTKDFGGLLVGTVAVTFIYERLIKGEENVRFLNDLKAVLREERTDRGVVFFSERPPLEAKIKVIATAQHEVIEAGTALRTFISYFEQTADDKYANHIVEALKRGVTFRCLLLNPERALLTHPNEPEMKQRIQNSLAALCRIQAGYAARPELTGKFEIYLYDHMPYFSAISVDGEAESGQMFVSPYLYGVKNANAPAFLITRHEHPDLHVAYWTSLKNKLKDAKPYKCPP